MKQPKPWFRASKSAWFVEIRDKQVRLGSHPDGAPPPRKAASGWNPPPPILDAFYRLMAADPANLPKADALAVRVLCDLFLDYSQRHHQPGTYANYKSFLQSFCDAHGASLAADVRPLHVTRWLDGKPSWDGARRHAVIALKRAYSWADQQGLLTPNPLRTVKAERVKRRTRILSKPELDEILGAVRDREFREFLHALVETGCRPSEVARVTAADVDLAAGVWAFAEHKTAKKTLKPRVVYLTPAMVELSRKLVALHPDGPLFRGPRDKAAFTRQNIRCRFRRLRAKLPHLKPFVSANLRATYATNALVNGVGVAQVAELLGHADTTMVSKHYALLSSQVAHMREAAKRATGG